MAAIQHTFVEQTTPQTHTGTTAFTDISGASIADTFFDDGAQYLIVAMALNTGSNANGNFGITCLHGSTQFADSERIVEPSGASDYYGYLWFTVWTAVAGEGIKLQHRTVSAAHTVSTDDVTLVAIKLSADLVENTDWFFNLNTTPTALTTTPTSFAFVNFTPAISSDWLVLGFMQTDTATLTVSQIARIKWTIAPPLTSETVPLVEQEPEDATNDAFLLSLARVYSLEAGVASTFSIEGYLSGTGAAGDGHLKSAVFALNLNKFAVHSSVWTPGTVSLSSTDFATQVQTLGITPLIAGDVWFGTYWVTSVADASSFSKSRLQVDNADQPDTQTSAAHPQATNWDARDNVALLMQTVESLTAASHTADTDASGAFTNGNAQYRTMWAMTMELAATGKVKPALVVPSPVHAAWRD